MPELETLWDMLQMYPRDYTEYEPASVEWRDGGMIQGLGTVTSKSISSVCRVGIDVRLTPAVPMDDGGWDSEDGGGVVALSAGENPLLICSLLLRTS